MKKPVNKGLCADFALWNISDASLGTEVLLLLSQNKPDLVLLDLMLPRLSGEEVLPHLQGIPVIVLSAKIDVQDKVNVLLLLNGARQLFNKTISYEGSACKNYRTASENKFRRNAAVFQLCGFTK